MKQLQLEQMAIDDLWALHLELSDLLAVKLSAEKALLEVRLNQLKNSKHPA